MIVQIAIFLYLLLPFLYASPVKSPLLAPNNTGKVSVEGNSGNEKPKPIFYYLDNAKPAAVAELQGAASSSVIRNLPAITQKPLALSTLSIDGFPAQVDANNQVADQQVLYEFKQTPPSTLSNLQLNSYRQPNVEVNTPRSYYQKHANPPGVISLPVRPLHPTANSNNVFRPSQPLMLYPVSLASRPQNGPARHPATSATIVNPVQHNLYTNHAPQPLGTIHPNHGQFVNLGTPLVYNPTQVIPEEKITPHSIYHKRVYHNQQKQNLPLLNPAQRKNPYPYQVQTHGGAGALHRAITTLGKISNNHYLPPITQTGGFNAPLDMQKIDQPSSSVQQNDEEEKPEEEEEEEIEENPESEDEGDSEPEDEEGEEEAPEEEVAEVDENKEEEKEKEESNNGDDEIKPFNINDYQIMDFENTFFKPSQYKFKNNAEKENNEEAEEDCDKEEAEDSDKEEEDGDRDDSKQITNYYKYPAHPVDDFNYPPYEFYEGFSSNSKYNYAKPGEKLDKRFKPLGKFKKIKYSKVRGLKPSVHKIQGSYSEEVPITHKQKVFTQRWFMTKNIEG
ncbi:uncharacterized protein [Euwallacea similis]|uniref:uncharacterized protein n=1 Tax=Euwallacea similis TaxID=1736056 RepID=UPI00344F2923